MAVQPSLLEARDDKSKNIFQFECVFSNKLRGNAVMQITSQRGIRRDASRLPADGMQS